MTNPSGILPIHISHALTAQTCKANETAEKKQHTVMREVMCKKSTSQITKNAL